MAESKVACVFSSPSSYNFMTFNLRRGIKPEDQETWSERATRILRMIEKHNPDLINFQEFRDFVRPDKGLLEFKMKLELMGYAICIFRPNASDKTLSLAIAYKLNKFHLKCTETLYLSDTPGVPSGGYGNGWGRIAGICKLYPVQDEKICIDKIIEVINTHLSLFADARSKEAKVIRERTMKSKASMCIISGDFNLFPDQPEESAEQRATVLGGDGFIDCCTQMVDLLGNPAEGTWLGCANDMPMPLGTTGGCLDLVGFYDPNGIVVQKGNTVVDMGSYSDKPPQKINDCPSDHAPIIVEFTLS